MDRWGSLCQSPPRDYPNRLAGPAVEVPPSRWSVLALLVLACLIPRAWVAWRHNLFWGDTLLYLDATEALEQGDFARAFQGLGLNLYPLILLALRRLPLDWELAGRCWSLLVACLAVLPIWGWTRRQFDDRVAVAACLCYAFHGKLISVSPLLLRDPTFWLLFSLSLYLTWRAVVEIRAWLFLAAGVMLTLAVHTRTEGWLLLVPLVLWSALRWRAAAGARVRLLGGVAICLAVIPLTVALVNLTWLRDCPQWQVFSPLHVQIVRNWLSGEQEPASPAPPPPAVRYATIPGQASTAPEGSAWVLSRKLALRLLKAFTYVGGALALIGVCAWRRVWFRPDHLTTAAMCGLLLAMIYIRYTQSGNDLRYFFPIVLVALPWMALGYFRLAQWVLREGDSPIFVPTPSASRCPVEARKSGQSPARRAVPVVALAVMLAAAGMADGRLAAARPMRQQAILGRWILEHAGPGRSISGGLRDINLVVYFAEGRFAQSLPALARDAQHPEVCLLWQEDEKWDDRHSLAEFAAARRQEGYRQVPDELLPPECRGVTVLLRGDR